MFALNPAEQRLAALLVKLADRAGLRNGNSVRLSIRLTRQDLADMVGVTVETATRIMGRFKREQLVSGTANSLVILDLARLKRLAPPLPDPVFSGARAV